MLTNISDGLPSAESEAEWDTPQAYYYYTGGERARLERIPMGGTRQSVSPILLYAIRSLGCLQCIGVEPGADRETKLTEQTLGSGEQPAR